MVTAAKARLSVRVPGCQQLQRKLNPVWHRMLYSCLILHVCCRSHVPLFFWFYLSIMNWLSTDFRNQLYLYKRFLSPSAPHHWITEWPLGHRVTAGSQSDRWVTEWPLGHRVTAGSQSDRWATEWPLGHRVTAGSQSDRWATGWPLGHRVTDVWKMLCDCLCFDRKPLTKTWCQIEEKKNHFTGEPNSETKAFTRLNFNLCLNYKISHCLCQCFWEMLLLFRSAS